MFQLKQVTGPTEPVATVSELKEYLRIDNNLEDGRIEVMESSAVRQLEALTSLKFVTQIWDVFLNCWPMTSQNKWWDGVREVALSEIVTPERNVTLPIGIGQDLLEFSTYSDDAEFAELVSNYVIDTVGPRFRVGLKLGGVWPTTVLRSVNGIRFRVQVGFGSASAVPSEIKQAVKELVAHMYENRGDQNEMTIPPHILGLVQHHRREKLGR
jgi:hypothetical protein